jgi:hypothetical protein
MFRSKARFEFASPDFVASGFVLDAPCLDLDALGFAFVASGSALHRAG